MAYGYNTPNVDASLRYLPTVIKVAKFDESKITFRKRPFLPLGEARCKYEACGERCTFRARNPICLDPPIPYELAESAAKLRIIIRIQQ